MIFNDRFQKLPTYPPAVSHRHLHQDVALPTAGRSGHVPWRGKATGCVVLRFRFFLGTSQRYVVYIYIYTFGKLDSLFVFTPKKVGMRFSRYIYMCVYNHEPFVWIYQRANIWDMHMPYDWNHDRSRGQPRVAWTDPRWAMGLVDYS